MKRFYKEATAVTEGDRWGIALDGKPLRTPAKAPLLVPSRSLAEALADEWRGQEAKIVLTSLPLTRIASSAIDLIPPKREAVVAEIAKYAGTDLLCYRAEHPPELIRRQQEEWQPLLDWAMLRYDAPLVVTAGILPVTQPPESLKALAVAVAAHEDMAIAAIHLLTAACGSLVMALAVAEARIDGAEAFAISQIDETFEIEQWGEDAEQTQKRAVLLEDIGLAERFLRLLRDR